MTLSVDEEEAKFFELLAIALTSWQLVESSLFRCFRAATKLRSTDMADAIFFAPTNFRTRLQMTDGAMRVALDGNQLLSEWTKSLRTSATW